MKKPDLSVYVVVDLQKAGRRPERLVSAALRGGATILQLRDKRPAATPLVTLVEMVRPWLEEISVPLIINDRVALAMDCRASGVHLGQKDMNPAEARALAERTGRAGFIIGVSVSTVEEARKAVGEKADYLSVSPLLGTATKTDITRPVGLEGLEKIRREFPSIPMVAIGGITAGNAGDVIRGGADGVAVVSAVVSSRKPEISTRRIAAAVSKSRRKDETTGSSFDCRL